MQRDNRRQPGTGYKYWAHQIQRLHGRHQVVDFEGNVVESLNLTGNETMCSGYANDLRCITQKATRETLVKFWDEKLRGDPRG